jgi:hypothetical protein
MEERNRSKKYDPKIALKEGVEFDDLINLSVKKEKENKKKGSKKKPKKK